MANREFNNTKINVDFNETSNRQQINSGESLNTLFGKIKKWFSDLKPVAFSGSYNNLSDTPTIPTKTSDLTNDSGYKTTDPIPTNNLLANIPGTPLDAVQGKVLDDKINQINSNLMAVNVPYELKNNWIWTSGTGIKRIGNTVSICLALLHEENEFSEGDKLIQFDPQYAAGLWTQIPALVQSIDGTTTPILLRVDIEEGGIVVANPFKGDHVIVNASWTARLS